MAYNEIACLQVRATLVQIRVEVNKQQNFHYGFSKFIIKFIAGAKAISEDQHCKNNNNNPLARVTNQLLTALILCILFVFADEWSHRSYSSKSTPNNTFLKLFMTVLYILRIICPKIACRLP